VAKWLFLVFKGHYLSRELQKPCGYKKAINTFKLSVVYFENRLKKRQLHQKKASFLFELA
tara:strand:- start:98 stop:277 length:180 start_codon:yes stop_codon:yes gene_type:complete